jgi:hypothetical protein
MKQLVIIFLLAISSECLFGQESEVEFGVTTIVKNTQSINEEDMAKCLKVIGEVDSIQLRRDTIFLYNEFPSYRFTFIYFDENNRLRKYHNKTEVDDGSNEHYDTFAYYDEDGDLVYYDNGGWYHCGSSSFHFYVQKGFIVDYYYEDNCDCCEKDFVSDVEAREEMATNYPVVGDKFDLSFEGYSLKDFLKAETLIETLNSGND